MKSRPGHGGRLVFWKQDIERLIVQRIEGKSAPAHVCLHLSQAKAMEVLVDAPEVMNSGIVAGLLGMSSDTLRDHVRTGLIDAATTGAGSGKRLAFSKAAVAKRLVEMSRC